MSRPGFPVNQTHVSTLHNTYEDWHGNKFAGTDTLVTNKQFADKIGDNTPGWPHSVRTNSYIRSNFTWRQNALEVNGVIDQGGGHFDYSYGQFGDGYGAGYYPWSDNLWSTDTEIGEVRERLIGKLIDQIQSHRVNSGEILHTRSQAASMVASSANRIAGSFLALRKGNFAGAARYLTGAEPRSRFAIRTSRSGRVSSDVGGIPDQWLALQYGWKPLLQDVYNSCEAVRAAWNDNGELFSAKASARATPGKISFLRDRGVAWGPRFRVTSGSREVSGKASVTYGVDSNFGTSLSQLGITNPASLAWELLPYSFVVDWFLPIGSFLERLDYSRGLIFKHGWLSFHARQDARLEVEDSHVEYGNITASYSNAKGQGEAFLFAREALTGFPAVPPPRFKDPFSLTHVANALSLLTTAFRK